MLQKIKELDFFSKPFSFNLSKGSKYYQTLGGGIITIIGTTLFFLLSIWTLSKLRDTTSPVISENNIKLQSPPLLDLAKHEFSSSFWVATDNKIFNDPSQLTRYFTIKRRFITTKKDSQGNIVQEKIREFGIKSCRVTHKHIIDKVIDYHVKNPKGSELRLLNLVLDASICGEEDPSYWALEGNQQSTTFTRIETRFYPCSLPDPTACASIREIPRVKIFSSYFGKIADLSNKTDPLSVVFRDYGSEVYIQPRSRIRSTQYFKQKIIYDNDRDFFGENLKDNYIDVAGIWLTTGTRASASLYCTSKQLEDQTCEPYYVHIAK